MEKTIKETKEVLAGLEQVGVTVAKVLADGKVEVKDASHLIDLVKNSDVLIAAVKGADAIPEELKDLSQEELMEIGVAAYGMVKAILDARKA